MTVLTIKRLVFALGLLGVASCRQQQVLQEEVQRQRVEIASLETQLEDCRTKCEGTTHAKSLIAETFR